MFTGIVEERGQVARLDHQGDSATLSVRGTSVVEDAAPGGSIAVNGCCLTVVEVERASGTLAVDVMAETLEKTCLGELRPGDAVNLERAVAASGRLDGHIVQGHIDGVGTVLDRQHTPRWDLLRVSLPTPLARYVAVKGSIAVDGVSLTVVDVTDRSTGPAGSGSTKFAASDEPGGSSFTVALIPTTLRLTTLGLKEPGEPVNLEVDVIAKYTERLLAAQEVTA
ncbi:MAG TPA: riboflavin synthase [Actinopolymorphaceae bacterium]